MILASASPRRRTLCAEAGLDVIVLPTEAEECFYADDPDRTVEENARLKYKAAASGPPGSIVIAADTVLSVDGRCMGKPADLEESFRMWEQLSGQRHEVLTTVAIGRPPLEPFIRTVRSGVTFKRLEREEMEAYARLVDPTDKAGGYNIEEHRELLIAGYDGSFSNIVGLPMGVVKDEVDRLIQSNP